MGLVIDGGVSLTAYLAMMRRSMEQLGLRDSRAAWLLGLTVRQYRALERGDASIVQGRTRPATLGDRHGLLERASR